MNALVEIPITEEIMWYVKAHWAAVKTWIHGKPVKAYQEKDGRIVLLMRIIAGGSTGRLRMVRWSLNEKERFYRTAILKRSHKYTIKV